MTTEKMLTEGRKKRKQQTNIQTGRITKRTLLNKYNGQPVSIWYGSGNTLMGRLEEHDGKYQMVLRKVWIADNASWSKYDRYIGQKIDINPAKINSIHSIREKVAIYQKEVDNLHSKPITERNPFENVTSYHKEYKQIENESKEW
jgi:small nuclear ribonucleoprotein (snRNP)-like protein